MLKGKIPILQKVKRPILHKQKSELCQEAIPENNHWETVANLNSWTLVSKEV